MEKINVAVIGCGGFARLVHIPNIQKDDRFRFRAVVDIDLAKADEVAHQVGADYFTQNADKVFADPGIDAVIITTPHHLHADQVTRAAEAKKHILCEKPIAMNEEECVSVASAVRKSGIIFSVGYNRSVAPFTVTARELLASLYSPIMIYHRMANWFPYGSGWLNIDRLSGGRVIGEGGHCIDLICQLVGKYPERVYAEGGNLVESKPDGIMDSAAITLGFPGSSSGFVFLSSLGNNAFPKEEIVITCANHTIIIYDFLRMEIHSPETSQEFTLPTQDKGQTALLKAFGDAILDGAPAPSGLDSAIRATRCTFAAQRSARTHDVQIMNWN